MKSLIVACIVSMNLNFNDNIQILWFIYQIEEFMFDFVLNAPFLRPVQVKFLPNKAMAKIDQDDVFS